MPWQLGRLVSDPLPASTTAVNGVAAWFIGEPYIRQGSRHVETMSVGAFELGPR